MMTEIEAIGILTNTTENIKAYDDEIVFTSNFAKAYEMAIKALEKQIPKKVEYQGEHEKCSSCGSFHVFGRHCTECGQAIDYE